MERVPRFLRITDGNPFPGLYVPGVFTTLRVRFGQVYQVALTDAELADLVGTRRYEEVAPGSFSVYFALVSNDPKGGKQPYSWKEEEA
jgi:hypothetical protein